MKLKISTSKGTCFTLVSQKGVKHVPCGTSLRAEEKSKSMYLIRQLAAKYKITRTTLLHYDAIKVLSPKNRTHSGYRLYSEDDENRLQRIILFRSMGLSLSTIKTLLDDKNHLILVNILLIRLDELNKEIEKLKERQCKIISLMGDTNSIEEFFKWGTIESRKQALFKGINPIEWHKRFEETSPKNHQSMMRIIGSIPKKEQETLLRLIEFIPEELKEIMKNMKKTT